MKPALVIMAAGMGSRYGGLKQLDQVGPSGETVMDYSVFDAVRAGFGKVVFVIRKDIEEAFVSNIGSRYAGLIEVQYAFQELDKLPEGYSADGRSKPWGTGQAALCAGEVVREPFAVINADDFYGAESYRLLAEFLIGELVADDRAHCCMCGFQLKNTLSEAGSVSRGLCSAVKGKLQSVRELTKIEKTDGAIRNIEPGAEMTLTGNEIVSMNMWGFRPEIFPLLQQQFVEFLQHSHDNPKAEFYLPAAVDQLVRNDSADVAVLETADAWFGVTYKEDRQLVVDSIAALVAGGRYPRKLF